MASNRNNGARQGFGNHLWKAADKLRNNLDAAEYKHVVLGFIFPKYIPDAFEEYRRRPAAIVNHSEGNLYFPLDIC